MPLRGLPPIALVVAALFHGAAAQAASPDPQAPEPQAVAAEAGGALLPGDRLELVTHWLDRHPDDATAWREAGRQAMALDRFANAAEDFTRADALSGAADGIERATALLRQGRTDQARAVIEAETGQQAQPGEDGRRQVVTAMARALAAAGDLGRARTMLEAALAQWPQDTALLTAMGRVELALGRPLRAAVPLAEVVKGSGPAVAEAGPLLVEAWTAAGLPARAVDAYDALRRAGLPPDPRLVVAGLRAAEAARDQAAAQRLGEDGKQAWNGPGAALADLGGRRPWLAAPLAAGSIVPAASPYLDQAERAADPAAARAALDRGLAEVPAVFAGQRALLLERKAATEDLGAALADLSRAGRLGLPEGEVHRSKARRLAEAKRWAEAAPETWAWSMARPDDGEAIALLFQPEILDRVGWPLAFARLTDWVERNPADLDRRLESLRRQTGPGGSPVRAMVEAEALSRGASDDPRVAEAAKLRADLLTALARRGRVVDLDLVGGRLVLEKPDGVRIVAEFQAASGRLVSYAEGPAWMRATWDGAGSHLLSLKDAAGNAIRLDWQGARLAALHLSGGETLTAVIGPDGDLLHTEPSGDAAVAAYLRAASVIAAWGKGDLDAVPEMPLHDQAFEQLAAAEVAGGDGAGLATAGYLVGHLDEHRAYLAEARRRLDALLDHALAGKGDRPQGLQAAHLWARLAAASWPQGLPAEVTARWTAIRTWADDSSLEREGVVMTKGAGERSWLARSGLWRLQAASCALPAGQAAPRAVVARRNGDVVVGTADGLRVLQGGAWRCYAFDPGEGRFAGDEAGEPAGGPVEISALAETSDQVLWLVAGNRLLRLVGPYDGMAAAWPLGRGTTTGLAVLDDGVLVASSGGLRLYGRGGRQRLPAGLAPLDGRPVGFLSVAGAGPVATVLAGTPKGLAAWRGGSLWRLTNRRVDAALWLPTLSRLVVLVGGHVMTQAWAGDGQPSPAVPLPDGQLDDVGRPYALAPLTDANGATLAAVLSSRGLAVLLADGEAVAHPLGSRVSGLAAGRGVIWAVSPSEVWAAAEGIEVK